MFQDAQKFHKRGCKSGLQLHSMVVYRSPQLFPNQCFPSFISHAKKVNNSTHLRHVGRCVASHPAPSLVALPLIWKARNQWIVELYFVVLLYKDTSNFLLNSSVNWSHKKVPGFTIHWGAPLQHQKILMLIFFFPRLQLKTHLYLNLVTVCVSVWAYSNRHTGK